MFKKTPIIPFVLVTTLFFMWGLAHNMTDTLLAAFKKIMSMTDYQTTFVQYAFYGAYFCLAIPAALLIRKFSYKSGILLGLGMYILGGLLFYPASKTMAYSHFLVALFILAGGLAVLETAANPYVIALGPQESGVQRLNFAQSFNPIGSITGVALSKLFILSNLNQANEAERSSMAEDQLFKIQSEELAAVMGPYVGVAFFLLLLWMIFAFTKMPAASDESGKVDLATTFGRLFKNKDYTKALLAQFLYVGAQIGVWSFTIRYAMKQLSINESEAANYYLAALILFLSSRFVCTWLMKFITPGKLLSVMSLLAVLLSLVVIFVQGSIGVYALVGISGCMSLMFPTIYGIGLRDLGNDTKVGGSGLVMTIVGGAVITGIQGQISDNTGSIEMSYLIPLLCFLFIAWYGYKVKPVHN